MKDNQKKSFIYSILGILALITAVGTISYSFFTFIGEQSDVNYITTGTVNFKFDMGSSIDLENVYPVSSPDDVTGEDSAIVIDFDASHSMENGVKYEIVLVKDSTTTLAVPDETVKAKVTFDPKTFGSDVTCDIKGNYATGDNLDGISTNTVNYTDGNGTTQNVTGILLADGVIAKSETPLKPSITIKMWLDADKLHVSDTVKRTTETSITKGDTSTGNVTQSGNLCYPATADQANQYILRTSEFNNKLYSTKVNVYVWEITG